MLAATVAIGAGAQPILANFSAGLLLILFRPYRVGDWVTVAGESFEVRVGFGAPVGVGLGLGRQCRRWG